MSKEIIERFPSQNTPEGVAARTDAYFKRTAEMVETHGEATVTYAIFMRSPVIVAIDPALEYLKTVVPEATFNRTFTDKSNNTIVNNDGNYVPSKKKIVEITGPFSKLVMMETLILQKIGVPCVAAYRAYQMVKKLPKALFMDMAARHLTGDDMALACAYGASIGSKKAQDEFGAVGFVGSSTDITASFYGRESGMGTMPHAAVGYAKALSSLKTGWKLGHAPSDATLKSVQLFCNSPAIYHVDMVVALVDFEGREYTDALMTAEWFYNSGFSRNKSFGVRLDTHGGRFAEGLDWKKSVEVMESWLNIGGEYEILKSVMGEHAFEIDVDDVLKDKIRPLLFGTGVSAANIVKMHIELFAKGFKDVAIIVSSGFDPQKCAVMGAANVPITMVGTGSFIPDVLKNTFATADIINYRIDNVDHRFIKVGRESLL